MTLKSKLNSITLATIVTGTIAFAAVAQAENHHYPKLTPADPPCLFLMDENGNSTGNATNAPCTQSAGKGREIDKASPMLAKRIDKSTPKRIDKSTPKRIDKSSPMLRQGNTVNREKGSGMATGRR